MSGEKVKKKKGEKAAEAVEAAPVVSERVAANRRWREHLRSMRCCWPEWNGPKVCNGIDGLCEVGQCIAWNETHNENRFHYTEQCRVIEIGPRFAWVRAVLMDDGEDPDVLLLQWDDVWPPTKELWKLRNAEEAAEGEFLDQVNKEKENDMSKNVNDGNHGNDDVVTTVIDGRQAGLLGESDQCGVISEQEKAGDGVDGVDQVDPPTPCGTTADKREEAVADAGAAPVGRRLGVLTSIAVVDLFAHPENRDADHGLEFQELCASVRELGILQPLIVRWKQDPEEGEWYEILAGHRRHRAAVACGLTHVPCVELHDCSDDDALAVLVVENFERKNLDLVEEAEAMEVAMRVLEWDVETVARKFSRHPGYIQLSLRLLDLDGAARKLVKSGGVKRETIAAVLALPDAAERERAVQLCFWPGGSSDPLNGHQARQMITAQIVRPREEARKWNEGAVKLEKKIKKEWKDRTRPAQDAAAMGAHGELTFDVRVPGYEEAMRFVEETRTWTRADEVVPASMLVADRSGTRWWMIAALHGLPGYYLPVDGVGQGAVYVNRQLLIAGETARNEVGLSTFLAFGGAKVDPPALGSGAASGKNGSEGSDGDEDADEVKPAQGPAERRTVTRDSGRTVTVSRDRLERVRDLFKENWDNRNAPVWERDEMINRLPKVLHDVYAEDGQVLISWVLDGCPEG